MADTTFENGTLITSEWCNEVNDLVNQQVWPTAQFAVHVPIAAFNYAYDSATFSAVVANPAGTLATGTVTFAASTPDGKVVKYFTTKEITAITWASSNVSDTFVGFPSTLLANTGITAYYDGTNSIWYRIA